MLVSALSLGARELQSPIVAACDLALLLPRCRPELLAARAREGRVARALGLSLCWLLRLGGAGGPAEGDEPPALRLLGVPLEAAALRGLLDSLGLSRPLLRLLDGLAGHHDLRRLPLRRPEELFRKALLIDRPLDAARLAASTLRRRLARALRAP